MNIASAAKEKLLTLIDQADAAGSFTDESFAQLATIVDELRPLTAVPAPMDALDQVEGVWETVFAHFGAKHSAGKPKVHDSNLKVQSFNAFEPIPIRVLNLCQEIAREGSAYNNVVDFMAADGVTPGVIIVHGRFREEPDNRQRFAVDFHAVELRPAPESDEATLRAALGFDQAQSLTVTLKPPRLHSDVIYLDDELRINAGSLGGLYVLRRASDRSPRSVSSSSL
jgi:hypothetical protein